MTKEELFKEIVETGRIYLTGNKYPERGTLVISSTMSRKKYNFDNAIGYPVQIRKKRGAYGSDQYFIRHSDGSICIHENQSFYKIDGDLAKKALKFFKYTIEDEIDDLTYKGLNNDEENGYIIELKDDDIVSESPPFTITTKIIK